jgi:spermidine synthase
MIRTGLLFGLLNALIALWTLYIFRLQLPRQGLLRIQCGVTIVLLVVGFMGAGKLTTLAEQHLYADEIIYSKTTQYQRIVVTHWHDDIRLFLNNNLQFSSRDEYRYHEALIHPALQTLPAARKVLVLGGGDGMAVRELLKYPQIESITLVDLDQDMTKLFRTASLLTALNGNSLNSPKVNVINADALVWLESHAEDFDFITVDFPDPSNYSLGKLYSTAFYRLLERHLRPQGLMVIQSTSPLYAPRSFWTIVATLDAVGLQTAPYHTLVPSFGEWGYVIAGRHRYVPPTEYSVPLRFLTPEITAGLFTFPADMARRPTEPNQLTSQNLVRIFEQEWKDQIR